MPFQAKMIADSVSEAGSRICTMEMTYPLIVHNEDLRHRTHWKTDSLKFEQWLDAGRSVMSNRAIAPANLRQFVLDDPYVPTFVQATKGMVGGDPLADEAQAQARYGWLKARDAAVKWFDYYDEVSLRVHKQHRNRLLMPFQFVTVVTTANAQWWEHWFALRDHPNAQPDISKVAAIAHELYRESKPRTLREGEWHTPYVSDEDVNPYAIDVDTFFRYGSWSEILKRISAARCARTSYMRQGLTLPVRDDLRLYDDLVNSVPAHDSPREHVCTPLPDPDERAGHLVGWASMRHFEGIGA